MRAHFTDEHTEAVSTKVTDQEREAALGSEWSPGAGALIRRFPTGLGAPT